MTDFNIILFDGFETLDAFGPAEIIGMMREEYNLEYYSINGGIVTSNQNIQVNTKAITEVKPSSIVLIPGGIATRKLVYEDVFISKIAEATLNASHVLTVCTGTALLAKTEQLNGFEATSNKMAFDWVSSQNDKVKWRKKARWVVSGKFYTSSGVSAGMDMALGFISDNHGRDAALNIARIIEYVWNENNGIDPFAE